MTIQSTIRICKHCGKGFRTNPARKKRFCSIYCASKRVITEEHKRKNSEANKGKHLSENTKQKIRKSHLGLHPNNETREKMSISLSKRMVGNKIWQEKKHTEETKRKMKMTHKGKKFSEEHKINLRKSLPRGEKHFCWKGGITPENQKIRTSLELKLWKKASMERDEFTCQKCKIVGDKLCVHHINNFADFKELRTSISNGITFCKNCHQEFHKKYGNKNNTKKQLTEFLNN